MNSVTNQGGTRYPLGFQPCWGENGYHLGTAATRHNGLGYKSKLVSLPSSCLPAIFLLSHASHMLMALHETYSPQGDDIKPIARTFYPPLTAD